jgi:hypothetical protein
MKRFLAGALAGTTVLTLTVGCSIQTFGPKLQILKAAQDFATAGKAGITLKAGGRAEDLIAAARKDAAEDGEIFSAEEAGFIRKAYNSSLTIAWDQAGKGAADDRSLTKVVVDGVAGAELRVVNGVTYAKVSFTELAAKFGGSKADVEAIRRQLGPANPGVNTLVDGGWVWVSAADAAKFENKVVPAGTPSADPAMSEKAGNELITSAANLVESAKVTYAKKDKTHLIFTTSTLKTYKEAKRLVKAMSKVADKPTADMLDEVFGADFTPPADRPIVLDLWIDKGRLEAIEINFLQFVKGSTGRAGLRAEFSRGLDITAPDNAKKIDPNQVFESINGATETVSATLGSGLGSALGSEQVKAWAEVVRS